MIRAAALAACLAGAAPAAACEVALLFALDVSASVDAREHVLQREGLARALTDPGVVRAVTGQPGGVALAAYEWSGRQHQVTIARWRAVADRAGLAAFSEDLAGAARSHSDQPTALGYALGYGAGMMRRAPPCRRRVIDVSGDGVTNEGFGPFLAYREFPFEGITVNGLAIGQAPGGVAAYYRAEVARGPAAFVETAADFTDYARAIRRKLLRELSGAAFVAAGSVPEMAHAREDHRQPGLVRGGDDIAVAD